VTLFEVTEKLQAYWSWN